MHPVPPPPKQEQRLSTAALLEKIVSQAAEEDGGFYFPVSKERTLALRAVRAKGEETAPAAVCGGG